MRKCSYCGGEYKPGAHFPEEGEKGWSVFCDGCTEDRLHDLPTKRYLLALERLKGLIEGGLELKYWDCNVTGNKGNACSWGMCNDSKEMWSDAEDHIWPRQFTKDGRIAPLSQLQGDLCPLDRRVDGAGRDDEPSWGCFYSCRVFCAEDGLPSATDVVGHIDRILTRRRSKAYQILARHYESGAFDVLLDETEPETPEEIDEVLREAGYVPSEVAARMRDVAQRAIARVLGRK